MAAESIENGCYLNLSCLVAVMNFYLLDGFTAYSVTPISNQFLGLPDISLFLRSIPNTLFFMLKMAYNIVETTRQIFI